MNDVETRALLEHYARELTILNKEPQHGYGVIKKSSIVEKLKRMTELAEGLD